MKLEELTTGTRVKGLAASGVTIIENVQWIGDQGVKVIFKDSGGALAERLLYRDDEPTLDLVEAGRPWSFTGDGNLLRLASEAYRIQLAWLFDPFVAITTSVVEPLPHQISAVYEEMLPRQPMRFLLADDPGAGKTIMAGLLIKELKVRGDLERCLIVAPGSLTDQWQDELTEKFGLHFEILTGDMIQAARTANPFENKNLLIARMDQLSRNEELQEKLQAAPEWDLVICDEAHRMSGHVFGNEVKLTKRYHLGKTIGGHCRNLLLMTATPHNGKEEDFQIFLALLDGDRFEGKFRDGVHTQDPSDLMRRMVKEELLRFDGSRLFPERRSHTVQYELSAEEANLYGQVTDYVREEMNRVERREAEEGGAQRRVNVGFALMTLQRRLASSPESIYRSLTRRRERLESRLREQRVLLRGATAEIDLGESLLSEIDESTSLDDLYDDTPQEEIEEQETQLVDNATASATIEELEAEIVILEHLEGLARSVVRSGQDAKWNQLNEILNDPLMTDADGNRRKLVIFSEFKDTLAYLGSRICNRLGREEAVVEIHGSVTREKRRQVIHAFMNDPEVLVLIANDAAGEGVNLQRAHLMINYDLPWNPNRLEQRFGRIHRIGQREVCHLWNLIAKDTREGDVYIRLLEKLEAAREALGGKVYDVLGRLFDQKALRELLEEAIRYGDDPEVKAQYQQVVDGAVDQEHLRSVMEEHVLVSDSMDTSKIAAIREDMERALARRLQPHFIQAFFLDAFARLGGKVNRREEGRWEISHVPQAIRDRDRYIGMGAAVLKRYERICFDKDKVDEQPRAELICPGSPLLDATINLVLERYGETLKQGAVLIDEEDESETPRLLFYLEHAIHDGRRTRQGLMQTISKRLQFVEVDESGEYKQAGAAPYLDYRPITEAEQEALTGELDADWLKRDWDEEVMKFATTNVIPSHMDEVKPDRLVQIDKVEREVKERLTKEINLWDRHAQDLKDKERAGKNTRLPAAKAQERADRLSDRLQSRMADIQKERHIVPGASQIKGGALVIPRGLLEKRQGKKAPTADEGVDAEARKKVEMIAMDTVMKAERALEREPKDVSATKGLGHDIESRAPDGTLVFIEVKGRAIGADQVTLTTNEIRRANNVPDQFRLAIVVVENDTGRDPVYIKDFDYGEPGFSQNSASFNLSALMQHGGSPQ
jgi:SNF2 family DNA or RNA helicase